ncbi:MAG TPA: sigma-54 dependent transcriptional regulator [Blastocatellia bacterium]|nr:sigma-54 dependent transcriptional regulator [Blastocatellia bacterium]
MKKNIRILVIDDEASITDALRLVLSDEGYAVEPAATVEAGMAAIDRTAFDLVITDVQLPGELQGGMKILKHVKAVRPETEVILITGYGSIPQAVEATRAGAFYFIEKPFEPEQILLIIEKALERRLLLAESEDLRKRLSEREGTPGIVCASRAMQHILQTIESVARSDANVLIIGESGTGKELIANALHYNSLRADSEFVKVNCSALPKELIESELFGYVKGAFTGAAQDRAGLFAQAHRGSLLLDELAEMPITLQPKLLRVLEERRYRRVGDRESREVDFRLICSTNRPPAEAIKEGLLREDLFYRVSTITIYVPPLRERPEDLPLIIDHFFRLFTRKYERQLSGISRPAYQHLLAWRWPGNVRELQNAIERAVLLAKGQYVEVEDLPFGSGEVTADDFFVPPNMTLAEIERLIIAKTLQRTNGNKQEAARILGIYRPRLYGKIRKYGIEVAKETARAAGRQGKGNGEAKAERDAESSRQTSARPGAKTVDR